MEGGVYLVQAELLRLGCFEPFLPHSVTGEVTCRRDWGTRISAREKKSQ